MWAFRSAWRWIPRLSESTVRGAARLIADVAWLRNGAGVRQLERNLSRVTEADPEALRVLVREALRKYADYWALLFHISGWPTSAIVDRVVFHHPERLADAKAKGRGVVIGSTHSGNWDMSAIALAAMFGSFLTVAERLRPEALFDEFVRHRESYGIEILPHRGGARPAFDVLRERVRSGGVVALVSDRDLSRRGVEVSFFERPARMAAGPAALAHETGAPLVPCAMWVDGDVIHVLAHEPLDFDATASSVEELTQRLADVYARDIAAHPTDWHMLQVVWREDMRTS